MIKKVTIENFKRFEKEIFELDDSIILAGPNNSGKTTLLQALATWAFTFSAWKQGKGSSGSKERTGQIITRKDFAVLPLSEFDLLWHRRRTKFRQEDEGTANKAGDIKLILITVEGNTEDNSSWSLTMELRYQNSEVIYAKPQGDITHYIDSLTVVHIPPFSGIGPEEQRLDPSAQNYQIGQGKPGNVIRNLIYEVSQNEINWQSLTKDIKELFGYTLEKPIYVPTGTPFINCEYLDHSKGEKGKGGARYDIACAGSGFHQVLMLLSFLYARPSSILLLDEPDAHLHVILQRQIYERLKQVSRDRKSQIILATHAEAILDRTQPDRVYSFFNKPHILVKKVELERVREALKHLTAMDILLAEQRKSILYTESDSDFSILKAWAEVLDHKALAFFRAPFLHTIDGSNYRHAKAHIFALKEVNSDIKGMLILDGDNKNIDAPENDSDSLKIVRWKKYEIENYLLIPKALERFINKDLDLLSTPKWKAAETFLRRELPPAFWENPLGENAVLDAMPVSKTLMPEMFKAAGINLPKSDYYMLAANMMPEEISPDVVLMLDHISAL